MENWVTWEYYKRRRLRNNVADFLKKNECYTVEKFKLALKARQIVWDDTQCLAEKLPQSPRPKPKPVRAKLGVDKQKQSSKPVPEKKPVTTKKGE